MLLGDKMKSSVNGKCCFVWFTPCYDKLHHSIIQQPYHLKKGVQCKIEVSFWYSLAKWHRTVHRQPAAMRTCLETAGKGKSTYCLQTWTSHVSKCSRHSICLRNVWALRALASLSRLLTVEHCDHCEHEIHNRVWVLELELGARPIQNSPLVFFVWFWT